MALSKWASTASSGTRVPGKKRLPGWGGEFGVDFSGTGIPGTSCANCRSLKGSDPPKCGHPTFVGRAVAGKDKGEDEIPVKSGDPGDYCCNVWGLSEDKVTEG